MDLQGYVYDEEYGLYYLQSRYYNPEIGRFLNADALASTGQGLLGNNMFAYCQNNPVMYIDPDGYCLEVGALLTWIDCGDPNCPTSSYNNPNRYYAGYNNPKTDNYLNATLYYESILETHSQTSLSGFMEDRFSTNTKTANTLTYIGSAAAVGYESAQLYLAITAGTSIGGPVGGLVVSLIVFAGAHYMILAEGE